jgi:glyoxylase-like metal-dependent hydrolase (beta-lactamase superfamily II)
MPMKKIAPDIYVSTKYPGVNVGFIDMPAGIIAVDVPTLPGDARAWRQQILDTGGGPILYTVVTDAHPDRLLSAGLLGAPTVAARGVYEYAAGYTDGFWRSVVDRWQRRHPEAADDLAEVKPTLPEIMFTSHVRLYKGGKELTVEKIEGSTPGSAWIHLPAQDVLFTGDTLVVDNHPFLNAAPDTKAWLNTLTALRRLRFSKTTIVPGRGPLCDQSDTRPLSDYIALARRRARSLRRSEEERVDVTPVVAEMLPLFPFPEDERELIQRRIKAGIDRVYEDLGGD